MTRSILALVPAALLVMSGAGVAQAAPTAMNSTTVKVTAKDYSFALSSSTVKAGRITFVIKDAGSAMHDFVIAGHRSKTIGPGKTTRLTVTLKPGRYPYRCSVDSHAELGMKGVFRVRS